ncbi:MAG TPA: hypothetical protein VF177_20985 [Anaerolineae bacterium]
MLSSNLIRWSGLAALVGGVLLIVVDVAQFLLYGDQPESVTATTSAWLILSVLALVGVVLIFLGLVGLYARQAEQAGTLGLVAFLVAFIGTAMIYGFAWAGAFVVPDLAEAVPDFLDAPDAGLLMVGVMFTFVLFALGWLLFGLASLRTKVLPRGAAVLLMVGAMLAFALLFLELPFFIVVFGVALAWMGYALWSGTGEPALTAEAAA